MPSEGVIEPGSEFVIKAICHLADKRKYVFQNDKLLVVKNIYLSLKIYRYNSHKCGTLISERS